MNINLVLYVSIAILFLSGYYVNAQTVYAIKGRIYNDANSNSLMDAGETGVAGVLIEPLDNDYQGNPIPPQSTNANGEYVFDGLLDQNLYRFRLVNPDGKVWEIFDTSLTCRDPANNCFRNKLAGENYKASIVIENTSGSQVPLIPNANLQAGKANATLGIYIEKNAAATTRSSSSSSSSSGSITSGSSSVSSSSVTGAYATLAGFSTASSSTQYAGAMSVGISGTAFLDANNDGVDNDEQGVGGMLVYVTPIQGATGNIKTPGFSRIDGLWTLGNLKSNSYYLVTFKNPKDYVFGKMNNNNVCRNCLRVPTNDERPINAVYVQSLESYKIPLIPSPGIPAESVSASLPTFVTLYGSLTGTGASNPTPPPTKPATFGVAIFGSSFCDLNGDGIKGPNESPVKCTQIVLFDREDSTPNGFDRELIQPNPVYSPLNGIYGFDNLVPGRNYQMKIGNPPGYSFGKIMIPDYTCDKCIRATTPSDGLQAKYIFSLPSWNIPFVQNNSALACEAYIDIFVDIPTNIA